MIVFVYIHRVIVVNICAYVMITMLKVPMSSSESELSDAHDPMAIVSDDEIDHLIIGHPDGEHIVAPILDPVPLVVIPPEDWTLDDLFDDNVDLFLDGPPVDAQGDGEVDDVLVLDVPPPVIPVLAIYSDSSSHSVADSFGSVTSSAQQADDDTVISAAPLSPARVPTPPHIPEPVPKPDPVPFGLPGIAPLIPEPIPAPLELPLVDPFVLPPPPADVAPPTSISV
ncbi:hypothetical protein Hanom_Chr07g00622091 [Helianthus anomalus]